MEEYFIKEKIIKIVRNFFYSRDFHEVIPPILNTALPLEPNLKPFTTTHTYEAETEVFYLPMPINFLIELLIGNRAQDFTSVIRKALSIPRIVWKAEKLKANVQLKRVTMNLSLII